MSRTITVQDINVKENGGTSEMETQTEDKEAAVTLCKLFRFSTPGDIFLIVLATVTALATGCIYPFAFILLGRAVSAFIAMESGALTNGTDPLDTMFASNLYNSILCYVLGAVILLVGYISFTSFGCVAERQSKHIRYQFFRSVLRQNIAWFETHKTGELNTTFTEDILCIYEGIGIKLCNFLQFLSTWLSSIIAGIVLGWKLALAGISFSPFILVFSALTFRYLRKVIKEEIESYKNAGNIANETFAAIRTVHAFQGQEKQAVRYDSNIGGAKETGGKKGLVMGFNLGIFWALYFVDYAVLTWYAVHLVQAENLNPGDMLSVMALVVRGSGTLGFALPYIEILSVSLEAARKVFAVIDTVPAIDSGSQHGHKPQNVLGNIEFRRVCFNYPSRKNVQVLRSLNLTIPKGKVVALVGPSGSGKSTIVQLLQRFYDPLEGMICMDGHNIRDLNINWLRHQFGVVSQEPVLFDTTISENILCGNIDMNKYLVEKAARDANAHDFISQLPKGYDTVVGGRGAQLSGGQRQRIAIARALVRDPRILLLDEATSALDNQSEALVQKALEQAQKGRTTIVIAHRLSTVKNADVIVAVSQGQVVEQGTHDELIVQGGLYTKLVEHQTYTGDLETEGDKQLGVKEKAVQDVVTSPLNETPLFEEGHCYKDTVGKDDQKVMEDKPKGQIVKRLLQLNTPEWPSLLLGGFGAIVCGVVMPGFAVVISDFSRVLGLKPEEQSEGTTVVSVSMVGLGAVFVLAKISQSYGFARSGAALTARVRSMTFRSIVNQDMDFFDEPENEVGFLTTRLASDAQLLQLTTVHIGTLLESLSAVASILIILFISDWKLSLATVGFMPLLIITGFLEAKLDMGFTDTAKTKTCGKIFTEATDNIRTVASLCRENTFLKKYEDVISHVLRDGVKRSFIQGLTHGSGLCLFFWTFGTSLLYGSYLVQNEGLQYYIVIRIFSTVVFGSTQVGRLSGFHGDYGRGKEAAGRLFSLIDRPRVINVNTTRSEALVNYNGALSLKNLRYCYKSRPSVPVLNGFSLDIQPGHTVALVGSSGSGKSTVIQLIERFYDVENGVVLADNTPLPNLDLKWWRSQLALVSQEPILFDSSIADNIAYGDNSRVVSMEEIIAAARMANIHTFIEALPLVTVKTCILTHDILVIVMTLFIDMPMERLQGYETNVGSHGTQLSGGQKQRVAIARALIRNPKVLLLDEATSSLDSESERIIQETLDKAREGRTCIVIAHRLSTVQNSDKIAVLKQGEIIEVGSHSELLAMQGEYFKQISASERAYNL